ncbi:THAP domain-containing protein 1-like [Coccinella septempunctata]|uniref:THAP domain-containing protein 1-like n=1 Tax=Coccinella septempunctata TaxID=41139 RepID=UPI001D0951F0|nr:THAP domain-containing protein 1-like [Coccinella septempunctata]
MVRSCFLCKWRNDKLPRRSLHRFPLNKNFRQKWLDILGKSNVSIGKHTSLCSIHFEEDCFRYGLICGTKILKDGSLPTLYLPNSNSENLAIDFDELKPPETMMENTCNMRHPISKEVKMKDSTSDLNNADKLVNTSTVKSSKKRLRISINEQFQKKEILRLKKKISTLQRSVKRLRNSKSIMKSQLKELKKNANKSEAKNKLHVSMLLGRKYFNILYTPKAGFSLLRIFP